MDTKFLGGGTFIMTAVWNMDHVEGKRGSTETIWEAASHSWIKVTMAWLKVEIWAYLCLELNWD